VPLTVYNPGAIVENIRLEVLGAANSWATLTPHEVNLFPKTTAEVTLTFQPSADAAPEAGAVPFAVKATPHHDPINSEVEEGTVTVAALARIAVPELVPVNSQGYRRARHQLLIQNTGNVAVPVLVSSADPDGMLRFSMRPSGFVLAHNETRRLRVRVRAPRYLLTGSARQHRFAVTLGAEGIPALKIPGTFTQRPLLGRRLLTALAALTGLAALAYFLSRPVLKSAAEVNHVTTTPIRPQGPIPGPPGRPGPPGSRGAAGLTGATGVRGATGATGAIGVTGAAGAIGARGTPGQTGATGATGANGTRGMTGRSGATGTTGAKGAPGSRGPQGLAGVTGRQGPEGEIGPQGPAGVVNGYQQALTGGSITFSNPTAIVRTPSLPAGNYAVFASLGVTNGGYGGSSVCWTTPDSSGITNTDHVQAQTSLSQELTVNDIWRVTKSQDSIDLVCDATGLATVNNATITTLPLGNVTQTTIPGATYQ
jgi:hypothetical protein